MNIDINRSREILDLAIDDFLYDLRKLEVKLFKLTKKWKERKYTNQ